MFSHQTSHLHLFNPKINHTRLIGRHSLKMGYEYQYIRTEIMDVNPLNAKGVDDILAELYATPKAVLEKAAQATSK